MSDSSDSDDNSCSTLLNFPLDTESPLLHTEPRLTTYGTIPKRKKAPSRRRKRTSRQSSAAGQHHIHSPEFYLLDAEGNTQRYRVVPADVETGRRASSPAHSDHLSKRADFFAEILFLIVIIVGVVFVTYNMPSRHSSY
ncbi:hypothetical protein CORC01_11275 [Colletotrichum orchidophilum]|uniref:Uncharacterized protein n=1 Tax=Colletotrichum orchidophilum TaxID=1209926 RepID=A0A1G4AW69_9PEZI|nr:uncharacterized protein CORC01_11275 [Colletotrichum orchidophilum]OHE93410.1 hypothetical protein CORC01_11275 [Colletotrichum orchidophilum]